MLGDGTFHYRPDEIYTVQIGGQPESMPGLFRGFQSFIHAERMVNPPEADGLPRTQQYHAVGIGARNTQFGDRGFHFGHGRDPDQPNDITMEAFVHDMSPDGTVRIVERSDLVSCRNGAVRLESGAATQCRARLGLGESDPATFNWREDALNSYEIGDYAEDDRWQISFRVNGMLFAVVDLDAADGFADPHWLSELRNQIGTPLETLKAWGLEFGARYLYWGTGPDGDGPFSPHDTGTAVGGIVWDSEGWSSAAFAGDVTTGHLRYRIGWFDGYADQLAVGNPGLGTQRFP